ncbi:hypothetical protein DFH27DRAFT_26364 [Peziza echinospora]|nr:hypothetical protein DFH27DRAFT_26364 [Peziza echinospora]
MGGGMRMVSSEGNWMEVAKYFDSISTSRVNVGFVTSHYYRVTRSIWLKTHIDCFFFFSFFLLFLLLFHFIIFSLFHCFIVYVSTHLSLFFVYSITIVCLFLFSS